MWEYIICPYCYKDFFLVDGATTTSPGPFYVIFIEEDSNG